MNETLRIIVQILFAVIIVYDMMKIAKLRTEKEWMEKLFEKDRDHYRYRIECLAAEIRDLEEELSELTSEDKNK